MKFDFRSILSIAGIIGGALIGVNAVRHAASYQTALDDTTGNETEDEKTEEIETEAFDKEEA